MKYRIEDRGAIRFVGCKFFVSLEDGLNYGDIPALWDNLPKETFEELRALSDSQPTGVLGVFGEKHDNGFDYWMAASTSKPCPAHLEIVEIPAAKWAIFEGRGPLPGSVQEIFKRLYSEWFQSAEYERRWEVYELEWFSDGDTTSDTYLCEGWVPVVKRQDA